MLQLGKNEVQSSQAHPGIRNDFNKFPKNWKCLQGIQCVLLLPNPLFSFWSAYKTINYSSHF